jgi:predicted DNA-binding transcriptional regulator AlpA
MDLNHQLAEKSLLSLQDVLKLVNLSASTWYQGIKDGSYPKSVKIGPRLVRWRAGDIYELLEGLQHDNN